MYVALSSGQIGVFIRDANGLWITSDPKLYVISSAPILKLVGVAGKLWCALQNYIKIVSTLNMEIEVTNFIF